MPNSNIFVFNIGSSSVKFGVYEERAGDEQRLFDGEASGIGRGAGKIELRDGAGAALKTEQCSFETNAEAVDSAAKWLGEFVPAQPAAIGHRIVHGGPKLQSHQIITPQVLDELKACEHLAPLHIPIALETVQRTFALYPGVPQFACFDTAFHRTLPEAAARFPIPADLYNEGVRRYGFHGISYESILHQLGAQLPARTVIAHLGGGSSVTAVQNGQSVDTSMAFTPMSGIPMATRCGDVDPSVVIYLMRSKQMNADAIESLLNRESGMKALSVGKTDMRDLEAAAQSGDAPAQLAIQVFCRSLAKTIAAYASVLRGLDLLIFSGGIGEHSANVRARVCAALEFLGISLADDANHAHAPLLSPPSSPVAVRIVPSDEDRQIARHCRGMLGS